MPLLLSIAIGLSSLSGCGFVLHGGKQDITFDSKPPGVAVTLDNTIQFVTPRTISVPRASSHQATFTKEGYAPQHMKMKPEFLVGPSIIGNILPLFPVGLAVDIMTGAAWGFEQDYMAVDMTKSKERP